MNVTHLTLTGFYAGRPLCDAPRNAHDKYVHAAYAPEKLLKGETLEALPPICPACKHVWDTPEEDEQ